MAKVRGRQFFANPGPTNIPDSVLRALDRPSIDFNDPDFVEVYEAARAGVKRVLRTRHHLFMYNASGHGAWEASLTNLLSPGETILVLESGYFSDEWAAMAKSYGLEVRTVPCDWRVGVVVDRSGEGAGRRHRARHQGGMRGPQRDRHRHDDPAAEVRAAIDAAKHPALFLVDTISSLGSLEFRMDDWGIDCMVGGSQKGLMLPTGMSFTGVSEKGYGGAPGGETAPVLL